MKRMKHIFRTLSVGSCLAATLIALSCSSDDDLKGYVPESNSIRVVENSLLFGAEGSSATVTVETAGPVSATVDADWCTATVSGKVVSVTVQANRSFEGRTAMLTISADGSSRRLPVQQLGMVLASLPVSSHHAPTSGDTLTLTMHHDLPMTASSSQSWIHASVEGDVLKVITDDNRGGHIRRGIVVTESGGYTDTLRIAQYDLMDDIAGSYYMMGYFGATASATRFDVVARGDSLFMHWSNNPSWANTYIPLTLNKGTATLFFPSAMRLYESGTNADVAYFYDSDGIIASSASYGAYAQLDYNESTGFNQAALTAANWPGHKLQGFVVRSVRAGGLMVTTLMQLASPIVIRVGPEGTTLND